VVIPDKAVHRGQKNGESEIVKIGPPGVSLLLEVVVVVSRGREAGEWTRTYGYPQVIGIIEDQVV
jgi:hypothetical protein